MSTRARFEFKLEDMWIGVFWKRSREQFIPNDQGDKWESLERERVDVWICLIPCVPLHVVLTWAEERYDETATLDRMAEIAIDERENQ